MKSFLPAAAALFFAVLPAPAAPDLRVGMIGLDTSHAVEFTRRLNDPADKEHIAGARVTVAVKGGSPDIPSSWNRVEGYTATVRDKYGVRIVETEEELLREVDVVMIESVDGRTHLAEAAPALKAGKTLFIDKPVAAGLRDVLEIYRLARESKTAVFSGSSLRYYPNLQALRTNEAGAVRGVLTTGPCELEPHHTGLYWYGIHTVESLYTLMGTGCESVTCVETPAMTIATGVWRDGKTGTMFGLRDGAAPYAATVFGSKKVVEEQLKGGYGPFLGEVVKFLQTGTPPVPSDETIEIYAFMEAADASKRAGGAPVKIAEVMARQAAPAPAP